MKRSLPLLVAVVALALALPGVAAARGHHRHHHATHHAKTHAKARTVNLGANVLFTPGTTNTPSDPAKADTAGAIASFTGGVLTLTLNDGSTVHGAVTAQTKLECETSAMPPVATKADDQGASQGSDDQNAGDQNSGDQGGGSATTCDTSALVPGAVVREAQLRLDATGAVFTHVHLAQ